MTAIDSSVMPGITIVPPASKTRRWIRRYGLAAFGALVILIWIAIAILAPVIAPYPPDVVDVTRRLYPPSAANWLGTDALGRDVLTRILAKRVLVYDYITAARTAGSSWPAIVFEHVLPNIWPTLAVNFALQFGVAVIAEASLSYLGLGAPPPNASWGRLLQEAQGTVYTAPIAALAPGVALVSLVIGINLLADGLRDHADPTRRGNQ